MNVRALIVSLAVAAGFTLSARADDTATQPEKQNVSNFSKYLPENSEFFVHVNVPKFFASKMVRKAIPMAFDKYGEGIIPLMAMAKQFNPNAPDVPEDQLKEAIKEMSKPENIAKAFDVAQNVVSDVVVAGNTEGEMPNVVVLVKCPMITAEGAEQIATLVTAFGAQAQIQVEKTKKDKGTIYSLTVPQQPNQKMYFSVPEAGLLHITVNNKQAEASFAPKGKASSELAAQMAKRGANDFVFAAAANKKDDADFTAMSFNLVLDQDLKGTGNIVYKDDKKAESEAKEMNEHLSQMADQLKAMLGDKADAIKTHLEKTKAKADGKTVNVNISLPGTIVDTLLKKD